jgi:hypothetical protein
MDFMGIALSAIAIGTVVMVGYYLISKISSAIPTPTMYNSCYGENASDNTSVCYGEDTVNVTITDTTAQTGIDNAKNTVFSGFSLITVGVIVLAAFGIIAIFS